MASRRRLTPHRAIAGFGAVSMLVILLFAAVWVGIGQRSLGRSDFTNAYTGGTLLRQGHRADLYDATLQAPVIARLILPDREGPLLFYAPPPAALLIAPLTVLPLRTAYRIWCVLQMGLLLGAVVIAARTAAWPAGIPKRLVSWAALAALGNIGTVNLLLLGQLDGIVAAGLAVAYALWRRGAHIAAGFALAFGFGMAKPHLALGLAVFILARRDRRLTLGAAGGVAVLGLLSVAIVGPSGLAGWVALDRADFGAFLMRTQLSFTGFFASWVGETHLAVALAAVAGFCALAGCAVLGDRARKRPEVFATAIGGALALSLVASPHMLGHDLTVLSPVFLWVLARGCALGEAAMLRIIGLWALLWLAGLADLGSLGPAPPGRVVPVALAVCGVAALAATRDGNPPHRTTLQGSVS